RIAMNCEMAFISNHADLPKLLGKNSSATFLASTIANELKHLNHNGIEQRGHRLATLIAEELKKLPEEGPVEEITLAKAIIKSYFPPTQPNTPEPIHQPLSTIYETNKSEESFSTTVNSDEENNPVVIPPPRLYEDLEAEAKRLISFILSDSVPTLPEIIKPPAGYTTFKPNGERDELYIVEILEEVMDNSIETPYMNVTFHISEID